MSIVDIAMPRLSDSMEEATVVRWLKQPGDPVSKGDELVEVETDKATIVYEAEQNGVLAEIVTAEGASAELGAVIARLRVEAGERTVVALPRFPRPPRPRWQRPLRRPRPFRRQPLRPLHRQRRSSRSTFARASVPRSTPS